MAGQSQTKKHKAPGEETIECKSTSRAGGHENEPWQVPAQALDRTWVQYNPVKQPGTGGRGGANPTVRRHAAAASANTRKQTIAARKVTAKKGGDSAEARATGEKSIIRSGNLVVKRKPDTENRKRLQDASDLLRRLSIESLAYTDSPGQGALQLLEWMQTFQAGQEWYAGPLRGTSLAQKAVRTMLWDGYVSHPTLFQAALFISGTHSNSCGLSPTRVHHMGSGMLVLRGASLEAVQAAVFASDATNESSTPVAIALLAGWERRYGDPKSYEVHMKAWRSLALPAKALEESNVSTLTEVTLEIFKGALDDRSFVSPSEIKVASHAAASRSPAQPRLLPGFKVFNIARPEVRSLLMLIATVNLFKTNDLSMLPARRKLGLEILAWSPTHTLSVACVPWAEESYDQAELNALYHARAALISINGIIYQTSLDTLGSSMLFNLKLALDVHCVSCQHLDTDSLLGTRFEELAFWSRFILCAISRDPDRDELIKRLLLCLRLDSWKKVKALLEKFMELQPLFEDRCREFYELLTSFP